MNPNGATSDPSADTSMTRQPLKRILIDAEVAHLPVAQRWAAYGSQRDIPVVVEGETSADRRDHTLFSGKREVYVTRHRGPAIKPCRGLERVCVPCRLHVINQTANCPFNCSYCFLQSYVNQPVTTIAADLDEMVADIGVRLASQPHRLFRVTTGDLGDSLAFDEITRANEVLVAAFARWPNALLELKTKSDVVEPLLSLEHGGRTVVSWSVNTETVIHHEEHRTASLERRLAAAARVVEAGYLVGFHFDPMVDHPGWEAGYREVVRRLFEAVPPSRVAWISMGSLRFPSVMWTRLECSFPTSKILLGELKLASDGKIRYFKPIRLRLYRALREAIEELGADEVLSYLCMELPEVWRRVMDVVPEPEWGLDFAFAKNLTRRFPHLMAVEPRPEWYRDAESLGEPEHRPPNERASSFGNGQ